MRMNEFIKVLIAEDETPIRQEFSSLLATEWPEATLVGTAADGLQALEQFRQLTPDVVFLDIRMPGLNGLDVAKEIGDNAFIVFTTAYNEYAIAAFESGAVDYLLKPIEKSRLANTIARLKERLATQTPQNLDLLIENLKSQLTPAQEYLKWVTASSGDTIKMIAIDEIIYFQSDQKYTKVVTEEGEAVIRMPLKELSTKLDPDLFWHIHRSAIVAVNAIKSIKKDELGNWSAYLKSHQQQLPVSKEFQRRLKSY